MNTAAMALPCYAEHGFELGYAERGIDAAAWEVGMKQLAVPILVLIALAALAIWGARQQTQPGQVAEIRCANPVAGCAFMHNGARAQLHFSIQPETLKPFSIRLAHPFVEKASASFQMADMNMGFNRYDFKPQGKGEWIATVTLPVCTASRVDWIAELELDGRFYRMTFATRS